MGKVPPVLKSVATVVAVLLAGLLLAGIATVTYRNAKPPEGYDQPRVHLNTKNTTRFEGADLGEVAARVGDAVFPGGEAGAVPSTVLLYDPEDWQGALQITPLLRPLNALLLPATDAAAEEIARLKPTGSDVLGARVVLEADTAAPEGVASGQTISTAEVDDILREAGQPPQHAIVVPDDPEIAR